MNDKIKQLAEQAGFDPHDMSSDFTCNLENIDAFAKLVAEREREACAKIVEESSLPDTYSEECLPDIANEIRARGQE
jgi:hypothetical protein